MTEPAIVEVDIAQHHVAENGDLTAAGLLYLNKWWGVSFLVPEDPKWEDDVLTLRVIAFGRTEAGQPVCFEGRKRIDYRHRFAERLLIQWRKDLADPNVSHDKKNWLQIADAHVMADRCDSVIAADFAGETELKLSNGLTVICKPSAQFLDVLIVHIRDLADVYERALRELQVTLLRNWGSYRNFTGVVAVNIVVWPHDMDPYAAIDQLADDNFHHPAMNSGHYVDKGVVVDEDSNGRGVADGHGPGGVAPGKVKKPRGKRRTDDNGSQ